MATSQSPSLRDLFHATPAKTTLLAVGPLALAIAQVANSVVNGFSPLVALGFAAGMIGFAVVATRHHAAEYRLQQLETTLAVADEYDSESARRSTTAETDD